MVHTTVVSSPGKVLIAGGYLVLDPTYSGTVVSTSSRFYTTVQDDPSKTLRRIRVRSPQFNDAEWEYIVSFERAYLSVEPTSASSVVFLVDCRNAFIDLIDAGRLKTNSSILLFGIHWHWLLKSLEHPHSVKPFLPVWTSPSSPITIFIPRAKR